MPFVPVPKDVSSVKTKVALNLTKRQIICFSTAAAIGVPVYLLSKGSIGNDGAVLLMIGLMLPFFFFAMYEKDGQPAEKLLRNFIRVRLFMPRRRPYKTENFYDVIEKEAQIIAFQDQAAKTARKQRRGRKKTSKKRNRR